MISNEDIQHDWPRYWYPREKEHVRSWWEKEEWFEFPENERDCFVQLDDLSDVPCLVLLGDAGLGKSTVINNKSGQVNEDKLHHFIDLRFVSSPEMLYARLEQNPKIVAWQQGNGILSLFLDSLDEGMLLVDGICDLLTESFRHMDRSRLYVRVTCRSGLFPPSFKRELKKLWGDNFVQDYQLSPLFLKDIYLASRDYGIDADAFLASVKQRNMHGFVYSPVTLKMLLIQYKSNGKLPETKGRLFELGCRELCKERKTYKPNSNFASVDKRYQVAMLLAAITVFCNKPIISNFTTISSQEGVLDLKDWPSSLRNTHGYSASDVEEVLRSGLFREFEPMHFTWAHYSYADFLASRFLLTHQITVQHMKSLVFNEQWNVIPQLRQTAAWLSDYSPDMFDLIVQHDPEIVCLGDPSIWKDSAKRKALEALLSRYEENWIYARLGTQSFYKQLYYNGIEELLSSYLKQISLNKLVASFILSLIRNMDLRRCLEDLLEFMEITPHSNLANTALSLYIDFGDATAKAKLKSQLNEYSSEFFAYKIIRELYPSCLSLEEMMSFLWSWHRFNDYTILDVLSIEDKNKLWNELLEEESRRGIFAGSSVLDYLIVRQAEVHTHQELWTSIGGRRMSKIGALFSRSDALLQNNGSWEAKVCLLHCFCRNVSVEKRLLACHWFRSDELVKLVELYLQQEGVPNHEFLLSVIAQLMDPYNKDHLLHLLPVYRLLAQEMDALPAVSLTAPICGVMKELPIPVPQSPPRISRMLESEASETQLRLLLESAEQDVQNGWPSIAEQFRPKIWEFEYEAVTKSRLWRVFSDSERERLLETSHHFLQKFDTEKYPVNFWNANLFPVHYALMLLWEKDSECIEAMEPSRVEVLIPYIVEPNFNSYPGGKELFSFAYHQKSDVINAPLEQLQQRRTPGAWYGSRDIAASRIAFCWDQQIGGKVKKLLSEHLLSWTTMGDLLELMYHNDPAEARDFSCNAVINRYSGLTSWKRGVASLTKQLDCAPDGGSEAIISLLKSGEERDNRFLYAVLRRYVKDRPTFKFRNNWSPNELILLYCWIHNYSAFFKKDWHMSSEDWKQTILGHRFSDKKLQAVHILEITRILPDCEVARYHWELVRQNYEKENWQPPSMRALIHMIDHAESSPITSGAHMIGMLKDSLLAFENEWRHSENPLIPLLWNEQRNKTKGVQKKAASELKYSPKDENTLSDTLKHHFSKDLEKRGITFHREVEVHRSQGGQSGARLDIKMEIPASSGNKTLRAYIEVKGCWNDDLEESMEKQLVQKYMIPHQCSQGLYVIGWYNCPQWDKTWDYRAGKAPNYSLSEAKRRFQERAEQLSMRYQLHVEVVVLDLSLR